MGKSYMDRIETIMRRYRKAMEKAQAEFNRFGEVLPETDAILTRLEDELAVMML